MTEQLLDLARQNPLLLPLLVGLISFAESVAFIGLVVPGVAILFALSALSGSLEAALIPLIAGGVIGAIIGDQLSFLLGRYFGPSLQERWPLSRYPEWRQRGETFFRRRGGTSIVIGRFIGPVRPLIPFIAGSCKMPPARFTLINGCSALAWSPAYLLPGYLTGMGFKHLPLIEEQGTFILVAIISLVIGFQQIHVRLHPDAGLWHWLANRRLNPRLTSILSLLLISSTLFGFSIWAQLSGRFAAINEGLYALLYGIGQKITPVAQFITHLGDPPLLIGLTALAALIGLLVYRDRGSLILLLGGLTAALSNHLLKESFQVARPEAGQAILQSYSFPSGHSSGACAVYAILAIWLLSGQSHRTRHIGYMLTAGLILLIGLSRALLGVHWPLDIMAGWLEGLMLAALFRLWLHRYPPERTLALTRTLPLLGLPILVYASVMTLF
ncbi:bifunctional DedA family/phosphatase PAP2 family protein [Marinobacterium lutimaris]|uniref:Undecaprenyl-diphosphatase n=1 Tax=Marinobacterium lutimaris TaxID=568106 RepID=A0A1H6CSV1_9GAMM|nr:bifunctional DedA family/phosphatase PAP2 family protein [Marinobacterium lutimaris]SEG76091.1 undecaprenyl-diphosphatase [Marinobacterium lutimaris]